MQAVDRLEHAADASVAEPSKWKQEDKAYVHALLDDKETSRTHE
ncbi:MAG: hypothetical protein OEY40_00445 [Candidatus Bathyarchaeota archaeon]|nr:hypothetical protein [Candidatus Bathyarchaeota archaeon]